MDTYDYVIVGAGSAGCVLANRLTEDPKITVLLVEAGGWDRDPMIKIPLGWGKILTERRHDWMYFCEPEDNVGGRRIECSRGKVIGGCSSTNAMAYVRGNPGDFDRWSSYGLKDWSYKKILPYFRKLENWENGSDKYRGTSGPLATQFCKYKDGLLDAFRKSSVTAGYPQTDDYNGADHEGFGQLQMTITKGRRNSTSRAYLRPAMKRPNLSVVTNAMTTRVNFHGKRATGIEYKQGDKLVSVTARREVLLSGGVINTPQLLMLSGVGDKDQLGAIGVDTLVHSQNVGANLQDHVSIILMYHRKQPSPFLKMMRYDKITLDFARTLLTGKGFSADVPGGVVAFLKTDKTRKIPDLQILFTAAPLAAWPYFKPFKKPFKDGFAIRLVAVQPESRGRIELTTSNPFAAPKIHQNFLASERDWDSLRAGFAIARDLAGQNAMQHYVEQEFFPGPSCQSVADIDAHIRDTSITVHHPCGTCRMGTDDASVVDEELQVRGVTGLRVVDASVMPDLVSGNINAAVIMIAEKASDMIKQSRNT